MYAYSYNGKRYIQTIDKSGPTNITYNNWYNLMARYRWFYIGGTYRNLFPDFKRRSILESIIDRSATIIDRKHRIKIPDDIKWIKSGIHITACDGVIAGFIYLVDPDDRQYAICNVRHDGSELTFGKWERRTASEQISRFYVAYDTARKCMYRFYQTDIIIVDIDCYFSAINSNHSRAHSIVADNGIVTIFDIKGYDSFDVSGMCITDKRMPTSGVIVYGHLAVCVDSCDAGDRIIYVLDMRTGDIYEINIGLPVIISSVIHIV